MKRKSFYVAQTYEQDGTVARVKGGFETPEAAKTEAVESNATFQGGWWVLHVTPYQWDGFVLGHHAGPIDGTVIETGGFFEEAQVA